jgi:hypothetical protein
VGSAANFRQEIAAGDHQVEISADGYQTLRQTVTLAAGAEKSIKFALEPVPLPPPPAGGILTLRASPPEAVVSLDGKLVGSLADFRREVSAGTHELEISAAGYQSLRETVTVPAGGEKSMEFVLAKLPPPPAPPPDDNGTESSLDEALKKLRDGNVAFNTPGQMLVGKPKIIEAKLSVNLTSDALRKQLEDPAGLPTGDRSDPPLAGRKESAPLLVADRMNATLSGGSSLEVSPSGPQQQMISHQQVTTWAWQVTPKQAGTQYLLLSFDAVFTIHGKEGTRNINTFKRTIEVEVGWPQTPDEWFEWFKNLFEKLSWLWVTVLVPVGLWMWARLQKKPPPGGSSGTSPAPDKFASTC